MNPRSREKFPHPRNRLPDRVFRPGKGGVIMPGIVMGAGAFFVGGMSTLITGSFPPAGLSADLLWAALAAAGVIAVAGLEQPQ